MKRKIFIFGAGKYGKTLYHFLRKWEINVYGFLKSKAGINELCEEIPVYDLRDFMAKFENSIILLAVADNDVKIAVKSYLITSGEDENLIIDCSHFLEDNGLLDKRSERNEHVCILCGNRVKDFLPTGEDAEIFKKHHIIGGGRRNHALCPNCGSMDRNRWCMYVLEHYTGIVYEACTVLHFAPEEGISKYIRTNKDCRYYSADLSQSRAMLQIDMTDILFQDATFDYIIANHVLEHVPDEKAALLELKRVLKENGVIVMSFPICMDQETYENAAIESERDRILNFGQADHVRLYGKDYKKRLESYGLSVEVKTPKQEVADIDVKKYGFIKDDVILLCRIKK